MVPADLQDRTVYQGCGPDERRLMTAERRIVMQLVRRYPRVGGALLVVVGLVMASESLATGREMARFKDGPAVEGRVIEIKKVGTTLPKFEMAVSWNDAGEERTGTTRVYKYESEHFAPEDAVQLVVAKDDPGVVVLKRIRDNQGLVALGDTTPPLVFSPLDSGRDSW
jgi:hypothetical protein